MFNKFPLPSSGMWIPTLTSSVPGDMLVAYANRIGHYIRYGDLVTLSFSIVTSTFAYTTASGNILIQDLPFIGQGLKTGVYVNNYFGIFQFSGITKANYTQFILRKSQGDSFLLLLASGSGQAASAVAVADIPSATAVSLSGSITYPVL